jgi:hypothetical protein
MQEVTSPPVTVRLGWDELPTGLRDVAQAALGATVVGEVRQTGGFSPGVASRLRLANGDRVFVKAVSGQRDARAPDLYRREAEIMKELPAGVAPALRWFFDDGQWVLLALEDIDGWTPAEPWRPAELDRVVVALAEIASALTPCPALVPDVVDDLADNFASWQTLAARLDLHPRLDGWTRRHLDLLVELAAGWVAAAVGDTLMHADLRADNVLLTAERVVLVDWPYAVRGAAWLDLLLFLPSVAAHGGVDPEAVWQGYRPARDADPAGVNSVLAAVAGDFLFQSLQPAPPNIPGLRAHQRGKADAALTWLRHRLRA